METEKIMGLYDNIELYPYPMEAIHEFSINRGINRHDSAVIKGIIDESALQMYQYMLDSGTCVTLHSFYDDTKQLLFSGFIDVLESHELTGEYEVTIQLSGLTKAMDRTSVVWDYQSEEKTNLGIIGDIMTGYGNIAYEEACAESVIKQFLLQYEESDYAFVKRVLSMKNEPVFTVMSGEEGRICFGKMTAAESSEEECTEYGIVYDNCILYRIESSIYHDIGEPVNAFGRTMRVKEASYSLKDGISHNSYILCDDKDFSVERIYNMELTGISLDGTIKDRKRDKVKVELNMTPETGEDGRRWFGYSSVASSSDGSGWYCMPEKEEEIRLYCPTADETEAYVISAIRKESQGADMDMGMGMGPDASEDTRDPINKCLSNVQGQQVNFTPEGVALFCADGASFVNLTKEGEIIISAQDDIELTSEHDVVMRAENGISVMAGKKMILTNDNGAVYQMETNIKLDANRIKNNC